MTSENSSLAWLRGYLYRECLRGTISKVEWGRIYDEQLYPVCRAYVFEHSPFKSLAELLQHYSAWKKALLCGDALIGDRPYQVGALKRDGFSNRDVASFLGLSRTRVRECVRSYNKRMRRRREQVGECDARPS